MLQCKQVDALSAGLYAHPDVSPRCHCLVDQLPRPVQNIFRGAEVPEDCEDQFPRGFVADYAGDLGRNNALELRWVHEECR